MGADDVMSQVLDLNISYNAEAVINCNVGLIV